MVLFIALLSVFLAAVFFCIFLFGVVTLLCVVALGIALGVLALVALRSVVTPFADRDAPGVDAMVEANARTVVDVDVVHGARVGANTTVMGSLQIGDDLAIFAARRVEIDCPAGGMVAAFARSCDACAWAVGRDNADWTELGADLSQFGLDRTRETACTGGICWRMRRH